MPTTIPMPTISVYLDDMDIALLDKMVKMGLFPNRSQAMRMALMKYASDLDILESPEYEHRPKKTGLRKKERLLLSD